MNQTLRVFIITLAATLLLASCGPEQPATPATGSTSPAAATAPAPVEPLVEPAGYVIFERRDVSVRAMDRPLSSYSPAELAELPIAKRETVRASLTDTITQEQIEPTLLAILSDIRQIDAYTDGITIWLNSGQENLTGAWDIGMLVWAPGGAVGNITEAIAASNDRSTYQSVIQERPDVAAYLALRADTGEQHGLTLEQRQAYYKALWQLEGDVMVQADAQISPFDDVMGNIALQDELLTAGRARLQQEHGVTPEAHSSIQFEGFEKGW